MKKILPLCVLLLFVQRAKAQDDDFADAGAWITLGFNWEVSSKWTVLLKQEMRLKENYSRLNLFYTDIGMEHTFSKLIKTAFIYRPIQKYMADNTFSYRHRAEWDVTLRKKLGQFGLSYRHRLQAEVRNVNSSANGALPEWYSRSKFQVKYDLRKPWTPYIGTELRYQFHNPRIPESENTWHRIRLFAGIDCQLTQRSALGVYYLVQREWNVNVPGNLYITGVEYSVTY